MAETGDEDFSGTRNLWVSRHTSKLNKLNKKLNKIKDIHKISSTFQWLWSHFCVLQFFLICLSVL
jgi:hypothetical protein